jgi:predicted SnoaL-like aldol condensation-catalyzing enzyme
MKHIETEQAARVKALASQFLNIGQSFNQALTQTKQVRPEYMAHYVNIKSGKYGIEDLIAEILETRRATSPKSALVASVITDAINAKFTQGTTRYPVSTISQYLCNSGGKFCKRYTFGKVATGSNPHFAYYLCKDA